MPGCCGLFGGSSNQSPKEDRYTSGSGENTGIDLQKRNSPKLIPVDVEDGKNNGVPKMQRNDSIPGEDCEQSRQKNTADRVSEAQIAKFVAPVYQKSKEQQVRIKDMLMSCKTFRNLMGDAMEDCMQEIVMALHPRDLAAGEKLINQGEDGNSMYLIEHGEFAVSMFTKLLGDKPIRNVKEGTLGEVALALNIARTASVTAVGPASVWVLDRDVFNGIRMKYEMSTKRQYERFLRNVPIFGDLESQTLLMLADAFIEEKFKAGQNIIKQGDLGLKMYVLKEGICEAIIHGGEGDKVVRKYDLEGMYFGEIAALMGPGTGRSATVRAKNECTVLSLDKPDFDRIMGDSKIREVLLENKHKYPKYADFVAAEIEDENLKNKPKDHGAEFGRMSMGQIDMKALQAQQAPEDFRYTMKDMEMMEVIGRGGFGRVKRARIINKSKLPELRGKPVEIVAFKILRKDRLKKSKDVRHVIDEKKLMGKINHPFVARLFGVGQDNTRLFFVLEHIQGGDLFSLIRRKRYLPSDMANLCAAEVVLALGHMHDLGIIYRDLKPENVLLDTEGHVKVVDFGFAIQLGRGQRAWTQCGTPCYMAPELVLGKGYQSSVDWWALGVLVYEMLIGHSPFDDPDPMATLKLIIAFDVKEVVIKHDQGAQSIVRALLAKNPNVRLGCGKGDAQDVQGHAWFSRLDWNLLQLRKYKPPYKPELDLVKQRLKMLPDSTDDVGTAPKSKEMIKMFTDF